MTCPVKEGEYEVVQTVTLPKEIPPGMWSVQYGPVLQELTRYTAKFIASVRGFTVDEKDLVCVDITANFLPQRK